MLIPSCAPVPRLSRPAITVAQTSQDRVPPLRVRVECASDKREDADGTAHRCLSDHGARSWYVCFFAPWIHETNRWARHPLRRQCTTFRPRGRDRYTGIPTASHIVISTHSSGTPRLVCASGLSNAMSAMAAAQTAPDSTAIRPPNARNPGGRSVPPRRRKSAIQLTTNVNVRCGFR
jgi:hypothetical protein